MSTGTWLLIIGGSLLTTAFVGAFLYSLWLGLHRRRWLPLVAVTAAWLIAVVIYAAHDSQNYEGSSRSRIEQ